MGVRPHRDNVCQVGQPIDQRRFLCPVGDHLEHQFACGFGQRHIAEFIGTDQIEPFPSTEHGAELVGMRGFG